MTRHQRFEFKLTNPNSTLPSQFEHIGTYYYGWVRHNMYVLFTTRLS